MQLVQSSLQARELITRKIGAAKPGLASIPLSPRLVAPEYIYHAKTLLLLQTVKDILGHSIVTASGYGVPQSLPIVMAARMLRYSQALPYLVVHRRLQPPYS